jgi:hypothetical protein
MDTARGVPLQTVYVFVLASRRPIACPRGSHFCLPSFVWLYQAHWPLQHSPFGNNTISFRFTLHLDLADHGVVARLQMDGSKGHIAERASCTIMRRERAEQITVELYRGM